MKKNKIRILIIMFVLGIMLLHLSTSVLATDTLTFSGGSIGGTSNLSMNALSAIAYEFLGITGTVITNATMAQTLVLQNKEADISDLVGYQGYYAYNGDPVYEGKAFPELRVLVQGTNSYWHFAVLENSSIYSIKDLMGKRVSVGKQGFMSEDTTIKIFNALGYPYDGITPIYLGHADAMAAVVSKQIDAHVVCSQYPQPTFTQFCQTHNVRIIGCTEEEMEKLEQNLPVVVRGIIPAGTYNGNDKDILTCSAWTFDGCTNDLPEDVAYGLTKAYWENKDFRAMHWAALEDYKIEDIPTFLTAPYHIGAYKYYIEKELAIPEEMIPPEAK